jgi:YegS/Rv2252/BmrU family lipid kinase
LRSKKSIHFIINPISGAKRKVSIIETIKENLSAHFNYGITITQREGHATEVAKELADGDIDAVIAVGGDGSVNEVGKALVNTKVKLGVIPCGSGNGFARHLKIPLQSKMAIRCINDFQYKRIDTATINNEVFLATAGLGFDAHVGWKFADFGKRGFLSYMKVTSNEFFSFQPRTYRLIIDGEEMETTAFLINFANVGQYGNNAWIAPSASIFDGKLNVCILEKFPAQSVPDIIFKLFSKQIEKSKYYRVIQAEEIKVIRPSHFHMDGEPKKMGEDMIIKVVPQSLDVIC